MCVLIFFSSALCDSRESSFRQFSGIIQERWDNFESFCVDKGLRVNSIAGDGFCFLKAVMRSLFLDHRYVISFKRLQEKITQFLIDNSNKYSDFHEDGADRLVYEATEFFNDGKFTRDVVDILIQATADALQLKVNIYRRSPAGNIQCQVIEADCPVIEISLQFVTCETRTNPSYTGANHYNSVTKIDPTVNFTTCEIGNESISEHRTNVTAGVVVVDEESSSETVQSESRSDAIPENRDQGSSDELQTESRSRAIPETNELVIEGEAGDAIIDSYLRSGTVFPTKLFHSVTPKVVNFLPPNIDGNKFFHVKCNSRNWNKKVQDRRWFYMRTSSKAGLNGIRKVGTCLGSWECVNDNCSFLSTEGNRNWWHFEYKNGTRCCYSCGSFASQIPCGARKLVQFSFGSEIAQVYHIGSHKCTLKPETSDNASYTKQWVLKYPGMSFKDLKSTVIRYLLDQGDNEGAEQAAYKITNNAYKANVRQHGIQVLDMEVSTQSIEAVAELKKGSDKLDPLHIYKLNNSAMNGEPDYVMKSSSTMLEIALDMDQDGPPNVLQNEDAFFDGSHSRCTDFISLALWVNHPSMRRVLRLVSMEVKSESTENLTKFWQLVNEMLIKVGKKNNTYKFNPRFIMTDEAGAHFAAMKKVFGQEFVNKKCVTCQWHFLNKVNDRIHKIGEEYQEEFLEKAKQLCVVKTVAEFELLFARLKEIAEMFPEVGNFLDWYYARRIHLFPAFREALHSGLNLAEVGNSSWKPKHKLSLVAAAKDDITSMLQQEADYKKFKLGENFTRGKGQTDIQRATQEKRYQIEQGRAFAEMLTNTAALQMQMASEDDPPHFMPNRNARHKPSKKTKGVEGKGRKRKSLPPPTLNVLLEQLNRAKNIGSATNTIDNVAQEINDIQPVLGRGPEYRPVRPIPSTPASPNPPMVTQSLFTVSKCQGCPNDINSKTLKPPNDLLIRLRAVRPYMDQRTKYWVDKVANVYFHLNMACLQTFDPSLNEENLTMTNEMFCNISQQHLQHLRQLGFLDHIINNIEKEIEVSNITLHLMLMKEVKLHTKH